MKLRYIGRYECTPVVGDKIFTIIYPGDVVEFDEESAQILLTHPDFQDASDPIDGLTYHIPPHEEMAEKIRKIQEDAARQAQQFTSGLQ